MQDIDINKLQKIRLYFETKRFDMLSFFKKRSVNNAAVCLITKNSSYVVTALHWFGFPIQSQKKTDGIFSRI